MAAFNFKKLDGVSIRADLEEDGSLYKALNTSMDFANLLNQTPFTGDFKLSGTNAAGSAVVALSNVLNMAAVKCDLGRPPEDITGVLDRSGNIILRCFHNPPHEWTADGKRKH